MFEEPFPASNSKGHPVQVELPSGDFLVVAEVSGYGFHEVIRHVPAPGQDMPGNYLHNSWNVLPDNRVNLSKLVIRPLAEVTKGMAYINSGKIQVGGNDHEASTFEVDGFYIDTTEVRIRDYRSVKGYLPHIVEQHEPQFRDDDPMVFVNWHAAVDYAEKVGKRLFS